MRKLFCDRCRSEFKYSDTYNPQFALSRVTTSYENPPTCLDICEDCYTELSKWITDPSTAVKKPTITGCEARDENKMSAENIIPFEYDLLRDFEKWFINNSGFIGTFNSKMSFRMHTMNGHPAWCGTDNDVVDAINLYMKERQ